MPRDTANILTGNQAALLEELELLRKALQRDGHGPAVGPDSDSLLALLRLCPQVSHEEWPEMAERYGLRDWLAVPLSRREFPFLSQLQKTLEDLSFQTDHDPLTGLHNRRSFDRTLDHETQRAMRSGTALSLAMVDIDDFKKVNDTYGHPCGDQALVGLAGVLVSGLRRYDSASRLGGEEFAVLLPGAGVLKAESIMQRIVVAVRELRIDCPGHEAFGFTCSVGLASFKAATRASEPPDLLAVADKALYEAKASGKDQVITVALTGLEPAAKGTVVDSDEKRFLFTGG